MINMYDIVFYLIVKGHLHSTSFYHLYKVGDPPTLRRPVYTWSDSISKVVTPTVLCGKLWVFLPQGTPGLSAQGL